MPWRLRYKDRALEWHLAAGTIGLGLWLLHPSVGLGGAGGQILTSWISEYSWGVMFALIGVVHLVALAINGLAWWTPWTRTAMAAANTFAYTFLLFGFILANPYGTAVATYGGMIIPMLLTTTFRAVRDCVWYGGGSWSKV